MSLEVQYTLVSAAFLGTLLSGLLIAFAVLIMPGIARLGDRDYLRAFREIDGIIQRGSPIFGIIWIGSALTLVVGAALGFYQQADVSRTLLIAVVLLHLGAIQFPTARINIPLNNEVQALDLDVLDADACSAARHRFEGRWNRWNRIRTVVSLVCAGVLWSLVL